MNFFGKLKIKGVRLPRDGDAETGRLKGFGYADFEDRESLVEALNMNDQLLQVSLSLMKLRHTNNHNLFCMNYNQHHIFYISK